MDIYDLIKPFAMLAATAFVVGFIGCLTFARFSQPDALSPAAPMATVLSVDLPADSDSTRRT